MLNCNLSLNLLNFSRTIIAQLSLRLDQIIWLHRNYLSLNYDPTQIVLPSVSNNLDNTFHLGKLNPIQIYNWMMARFSSFGITARAQNYFMGLIGFSSLKTRSTSMRSPLDGTIWQISSVIREIEYTLFCPASPHSNDSIPSVN